VYYSVYQGVSEYVALAKREPFTHPDPHPIYEPGELYFEFGDTPEEALERLKGSLVEEGFADV